MDAIVTLYTRARALWGTSPAATSLIRQTDVEKWDQALYDLKRIDTDAHGDFGATGDGVTNDRAAMQAALDAKPGTIILPAGDYLTTSPLNMTLGATLAGKGIGVTYLRATGTGNTLTFDNLTHVLRDATVQDLTIYSNTYGYANAGIYATVTQFATVRHVQVTRHKYGLYVTGAEQFTFYDCWFDSCTVAAAYLIGPTVGVSVANYHKFYNTVFQGSPYGIVIANAALQVSLFNCSFYTNSGPAVYVPSTAVQVDDALFENCWFENNTLSLDLRAGSGFKFKNCSFSEVVPVVTAANFNHPGLWFDSCNDGGNLNFYLVTAGVDYKLTNANTGYPRAQCQVAGAYEPVEHPPTRGAGDKSLGLPSDMSTWNTAAATGGQTDPYGGTNASVLTAGSTAIHDMYLNGGSAIGGVTVTVQLRVKSNGGRVRIQLVNDPVYDVTAAKMIGLPLNDWRFVYYTFTWPASVSQAAAFIYVTAQTQSVYCYHPVVTIGHFPVPELPTSRDMSGWAGEYEVFGQNHNVRVWVNNAAPATGAWIVGDEAVNYAPAAGGTDRWRCTTAGTSGTWKAVAVAA